MNNRFLLRLIGLLCIASSYATVAQQTTPLITDGSYKSERYPIGEELFFAAELGRFALGDVYTLNTEDGLLIDFESYIVATDFQIVPINPLDYQGWYISEDYTFNLSLNINNEFVITNKGEQQLLAKNDIRIIEDILYVSPKFIYEQFGIGHQFDESSLKLTLYPEEKLPIQLKLERQNKKIFRSSRNQIAQHPELWRGYEILSPQSLDFSLNSTYLKDSKQLLSGYSVIGGREIAYHNMRFFLNGTDRKTLTNARVQFSKNYDISASFKDPFIKAIQFGDVDSVSIGIGGFRSNSVGVVLTNDPTVRQLNDARTTTISGEVLEGWDVELYRNNILIDKLNEVNNGRYIFPDISLFLGENNFEIVLYGPQGQVKRIEQNEYVNSSIEGNNDTRFKTSITKLDSQLLPVSNRSSTLQSDVYDWSTQISKRILGKVNMNAGLTLQTGSEGVDRFYLGMTSALSSRILGTVGYSTDEHENQSLSASLRASFFGHDFNAAYSQIKTGESGIVSHQLNFDNRGIISLLDQNISYQNTINISKFDEFYRTRFVNSLGMKVGSGSLSHSLIYEEEKDGNTQSDNQFAGDLNYRLGFMGVSARLGINYGEFEDKLDINNYSLNLSWSPISSLKTRLETNYSPRTENWTAKLNLGYEIKDVTLSSYLSNSSLLGYRLGLSARLSLGGEPFYQNVFSSDRNLSQRGTVVIRTFIDANANAIFDDGDSIISNVDVKSVQSVAKGSTNDDGIVVLKGLSTRKQTDIEIDESSIDEPFLKPIIEGISVLPRASFIDHIDYPLVYVSDIDGIINIKGTPNFELRRPLRIKLLTNKNELVDTTFTEFDGYFFFSEVPPGQYILDIDETSLDVNMLRLNRKVDVIVSTTSELITKNNLEVESIQFNDGFRVELASLPNLPLLKVYWQKIRSLDINFFAQVPVFYSQADNTYSLNAGFYESLEAATQYCNSLSIYKLTCSVEEFSLPKP